MHQPLNKKTKILDTELKHRKHCLDIPILAIRLATEHGVIHYDALLGLSVPKLDLQSNVSLSHLVYCTFSCTFHTSGREQLLRSLLFVEQSSCIWKITICSNFAFAKVQEDPRWEKSLLARMSAKKAPMARFLSSLVVEEIRTREATRARFLGPFVAPVLQSSSSQKHMWPFVLPSVIQTWSTCNIWMVNQRDNGEGLRRKDCGERKKYHKKKNDKKKIP